MSRYFILRELVGSDLGWFDSARRQGRAKGHQRGINFNADIVKHIFLSADSGRIPVISTRFSDGQTQSRTISKQQKNWRLVGDKVSGGGLDDVDQGDFFWCIVEVYSDRPTLIWDVVSRQIQPAIHSWIASRFGPHLVGRMHVWDYEDSEIAALRDRLGLAPAALDVSEAESIQSVNEGDADPLRSGASPLRPRARLVQAIGQDLISNEVVALVELIKNAYDADATTVEIEFVPPLRPNEGSVVIEDDGHGMTLDVLLSSWMEPATASKVKARTSPGGRRMTGAKGLGRFAAARLAGRMKVESVTSQERRRAVADFDWEAFRSEDKYLDQVQCEWSEFRVSSETPSGTVLTLSQLRDAWDGSSFRNLRIQLSRLMATSAQDDRFDIVLNLPPEFQAFAGPVTPPPVLAHPHYSLTGKVENGEIEAILSVGEKRRPISQEITLEGGRAPSCGPFSFEFKVWDRDREHLKRLALDLNSTLPNIRRDLNAAAGVSVYRDRFRVLPYGDETDDWLRLDLRRVQNPTLRVSNNQIIGAVYITAEKNPDLRDQTNREGIVDSLAFSDLRDCVGQLLVYIEAARYELRRDAKKLDKQASLFEELNLAPVRTAFEERYPDDKEFLSLLEDKDSRVRKSVEQIQEVLARYRRLSTLGQIIDVVLHDGRTPVSSISSQCALAKRSLSKAAVPDDLKVSLVQRFETIDLQATRLSDLFKRISPLSGGRRSKAGEHVLESIIEETFYIFREKMEDLGIEVVLPRSRTLVKADSSELHQIFVNLLENSIYWLSRSEGARNIEVVVNSRENEIEVLFSDSGPGVPKEIQDAIFDPYFSAKPEGVGIGLTIAGEIVAEYGGALALVQPGLLQGANFRFTLRLDN